MAEVALDRVCKQYVSGGAFAVRDVSLRIADGEFLVLVGPSGCGKTTTLRLVAGLEELTSGDVSIAGRNVNRVHPRDRNVAMVFQDYALYPHMTAYQNMAFGLRMRKTPRPEIEQRVRETAAMLGMSDLLQRRPGALSGGQRQRVALGRAIVRIPGAQCFLFDEPLSNLDAKMRSSMRAEIKSLHQRLRMTTIYVTHDQEEAMTLGERVVVMAGGVVQQQGPPLEVYHAPSNRFVAGFLGSPAMNFIDGRIESDGATRTFVENGSKGARLTMPATTRLDRVASSATVTLGVRPEDVALVSASAHNDASVQATVRLTELLGDQMNVHLSTPAGSSIIARCRARDMPAINSIVHVRFDPQHLHVFAPGEYGESLDRSS